MKQETTISSIHHKKINYNYKPFRCCSKHTEHRWHLQHDRMVHRQQDPPICRTETHSSLYHSTAAALQSHTQIHTQYCLTDFHSRDDTVGILPWKRTFCSITAGFCRPDSLPITKLTVSQHQNHIKALMPKKTKKLEPQADSWEKVHCTLYTSSIVRVLIWYANNNNDSDITDGLMMNNGQCVHRTWQQIHSPISIEVSNCNVVAETFTKLATSENMLTFHTQIRSINLAEH